MNRTMENICKGVFTGILATGILGVTLYYTKNLEEKHDNNQEIKSENKDKSKDSLKYQLYK